MNFFGYLLVFSLIAVALYAFVSLIRFAYVHIKAFFIRRKLSKLSESEIKDD